MTFAAVKEAVTVFLKSRQRAYIETFDNPIGKKVLKDLAKFCRANESTFHPDHAVSDRLDGRREVWLRIQQHLNLTDEELFALYGPTDRGPK